MNFVTGALPNVMFIVGMLAIGIALGIEFKIVEIKGQLNKTGRIGAFAIGSILIAVSVYLYTRPAQTAAVSPPSSDAAVIAPQAIAAAPAAQATAAPQLAPTAVPVTTSGEAITTAGVVRQISVRNNQIVVVIDQVEYILPSQIAADLGGDLRVGATLNLIGTRSGEGTVAVTAATVASAPGKGHEDKEDDKHED